jgi:hypothetical protein
VIHINNMSTVTAGPLVLDSSYNGDPTTLRVAEILHLDPSGIEVTDTDGQLAIVHYKKDAPMATYGEVRGIIVNTVTGKVIAKSFGYTDIAVLDSIQVSDGLIAARDQSGVLHEFSQDDCEIHPVLEGVMLRFYRYDGATRVATHRKITNVGNSRWVIGTPFLTSYNAAGGPKEEEMFDLTKPFSSTVYSFMVISPDLLVGTRQLVNVPYVVYLGQSENELTGDDVAPGKPSFKFVEKLGGMVNTPQVVRTKQMTVAEANRHLKYGYYNPYDTTDDKLLTGEGVIVFRKEGGIVKDVVRVHSPAYNWRIGLRGNNPNIVHQFYALLSMAYPSIDDVESWERFKKNLVMFELYDEAAMRTELGKTGMLLTLPQGQINKDDYLNRNDRIHLLWINYVLSLPPNFQKQGLDILSNFTGERKAVIEWIQQIESMNREIDTTSFPDRVKSIIRAARMLARDRQKKGQIYTRSGKALSYHIIIKDVIHNLLMKEDGISLFKLVRSWRLAMNPKPEEEDTATV